MRAAVVTFPGSNNDDDVIYTLGQYFDQVDNLWHKDTPDLSTYDLVALPGGFSYGDYLRSGAIASVSPILDSVRPYAESGKLLFGVCNGFQILCEAGLLPGALAANSSLQFACKDIHLKVETTNAPCTKEMSQGQVVRFPIAHGEGRYVVSDDEYKKLKDNDQILFSYVTPEGEITEEANPNGSVYSIAGVCNEKRNVFGLMPHPERATDLRSEHGKLFFESIVKSL